MEVISKSKFAIKDFELLDTLGTGMTFYLKKQIGTFGKVKLCKNKENGKIYAIKMLKKIEIIKAKQLEHVYSEYKILSQINHPFIVDFKGHIITDPKFIYFVMDYVPGGELFSVLRSNDKFPVDQAKYL